MAALRPLAPLRPLALALARTRQLAPRRALSDYHRRGGGYGSNTGGGPNWSYARARLGDAARNPVHWLIAANVGVFCAYHALRTDAWWARFFNRHMVLSPSRVRAGHWDALLGSAFMHREPLHLLLNMVALKTFGDTAAAMLGPRVFGGLYLAGALTGGLAQLYYPAAVRRFNWPARRSVHWDTAAVGASSAIAALTTYVCCRIPRGEVYVLVFPVPNWVFVPAFVGGSAYMAWAGGDTTWGHAGHLGGAAAGFALFLFRRGRY